MVVERNVEKEVFFDNYGKGSFYNRSINHWRTSSWTTIFFPRSKQFLNKEILNFASMQDIYDSFKSRSKLKGLEFV